MTAPGRPCSIPISKARRSDSRAAAGSIRASSTTRSVSWSLRAKCLMVERMWRLCAPAIIAPAMRPVTSGSSEKYSKMRPPRGSRTRFAAPPSRTLNPLPLASAPTASPWRRASERSQLDASARSDGIAVAVSPGRMFPGLATPSSASVSCKAGTPSRGIPGMKPAEPIAPSGLGRPPQGAARPPWTSDSFSACVIRSSAASARADELPDSSPHGAPAADVARSASPPAARARRTTQSMVHERPAGERTPRSSCIGATLSLAVRRLAGQSRACASGQASMERYAAWNQSRAPQRRSRPLRFPFSRARDASSRAGRHVRTGPRRPDSASTG